MQDWQYQPARDVALQSGSALNSMRREPGLFTTSLNCMIGMFTRQYLRVFHRCTFHGLENLPKVRPYILIANHSSHLDAFVLTSALKASVRAITYPVVAGDHFFQTSWQSLLATRLLNALPIWRYQNCHRTLLEMRDKLLQENCCLIIFPEGTRSRTGEMAPFKAGLGMLVAGLPVPVVPCYLSGCFQALPPGKKMIRKGTIKLMIGPPLDFQHLQPNRQSWSAISQQCEQAVHCLKESFQKDFSR
ncbi:MAG: lysophospholipid acyltransferase family protein [Zavarzinella sp.]